MATKTKSAAKKKPAKRKPAKRKPAKRKSAAKSRTSSRKPSAAKKAVVELREVENLIEAELEKPKARSASASAAPSVSVSPEPIVSRVGAGIRSKDISAFLRQLIMMLEAGTPILKSLKSLARRGERKAVRDMIGGIAEYVEAGNPLWQAFAREGKNFPPMDLNLIKASEASGTLTSVLKRIANYREKRERLLKQVKVGMIYPLVLVAASLGVIIVLATWVIPAFKEVFETMDTAISGFSLFIRNAAGIISSYWWLAALLVAGLWAAHEFYWVKNPLRRLQSDKIKLRIPIFGAIIQATVIAEFTRTFSMLLRSGISMMATLDLCKSSVSNHAYIGMIQDLRDSVESGEGLEAPLRQAEKNGYLPGIVVDMLLTGEESGSLEKVADQIAQTYEEDVEIAVEGIKESVTPVFVVGMGFIVGCIVIGMFLPLIAMIDNLAGGGL